MDHHGFMTGMLLGGALVALVPVFVLIGVVVFAIRQDRASTRGASDDGGRTREVLP